MIITHTVTESGQRRIYLGSPGSVEFYIEPFDAGAWRFEVVPSASGQRMTTDDLRSCAAHMLARLCERLEVCPDALATVPFDVIAAQHDADPRIGRRQPAGRRSLSENGYHAAPPHVRAVRPGPPAGSARSRMR